MVSVGVPSSSVMVAVASPLAMLAFAALLSVTLKVSSPSASASSPSVTVMVSDVSPGANLRVPDAAV